MRIPLILAILSAFAGCGSAFFWWRSAARAIPPLETYWDQMPDDAPFMVAIRKTSADNRIAAALSGVTALLAGLSVMSQAWP